MQRQSLGSPSSKLQTHGDKDEKILDKNEKKRKEDEEEEEEKRAEKPLRSSSRTDKFIHLIPVLTLFCFLILYLVSYDPSYTDSKYIPGQEHFFDSKDSTEIGRVLKLEKGHVLAIHGHRSLQEVARTRARRSRLLNHNLHRKFGDF